MMSDVDDYGDWKYGKRLTGISFAGNLFMLKMGTAVAGAIVARILSLTGYIANKPQQNAETIQDHYYVLFTANDYLFYQCVCRQIL